jgi:hypothetical protein
VFDLQRISVTGIQVADVDATVDKYIRGNVMPALGTVGDETVLGRRDWQLSWLGDHANMMYWRLDPTQPPSRGAVTGSYSYALPARKLPSGEFLPLALPGKLDIDYEPTKIEEAKPEDWIIIATTEHGDRRKLAFRNGIGSGIVLIADHRSDSPPDLSTLVHDGRGDTYDPDRKAGLHTFWEVRHWAVPGTQGSTRPKTISSPPQTDGYSIAWVADSAPDGTGFARVGFGDRDGLFADTMGGPFAPSLVDKHWLADTPDGPIVSGALSTNSYFRGSGNPFSAPIDFEEKPYPNPADSTFEYKVFLWYDANKTHWHPLGQKDGMWRLFTRVPIGETPPCSPTKDYSTVDTNSNPRRTFAEDSRAFIPKKLISSGLYLQPRVHLVKGRIKNLSGSDR